ncbi:uncharacterized protein LOC135145565 [Zophobas morio]|uniref:uncharacterized protein LOC135145565 n=1 Tax=Zophobas morio TaxID=2755281 RepID=UPI003082A87B
MALQGDRELALKERSKFLLDKLYQQHKKFIMNKLLEGVELCFKLVLSSPYDKFKGIGFEGNPPASILNNIYWIIKKDSISYRQRFIKTLLSAFMNEEKPFLYLQFLTENLAYFPYETHEETNFVCYCITNILSKLLKELTFDFQFCLETKEELSDEEVELEHVEDLVKILDESCFIGGCTKALKLFLLDTLLTFLKADSPQNSSKKLKSCINVKELVVLSEKKNSEKQRNFNIYSKFLQLHKKHSLREYHEECSNSNSVIITGNTKAEKNKKRFNSQAARFLPKRSKRK